MVGRIEAMGKKEKMEPDIMVGIGELYYFAGERRQAQYWFNKTIKAAPGTPMSLVALIYLAWIDIAIPES